MSRAASVGSSAAITAIDILGYFVFLLVMSGEKYRQVSAETVD